MKLLHFADAHIDMANFGRHDPASGLPLRVLDFLRSLDDIVETAIREKVDLVLFAGDAYRDRSPAPTFQREWGRRIMRLSRAGIRTLLLVGNHDLSPAIGRAHAIQEFDTLEVPHVTVLAKPCFVSARELGLPAQVIALPWISRSALAVSSDLNPAGMEDLSVAVETRLAELVNGWLEAADPALPIILTAHASIEGALYGSERSVMLGNDLVLSGSFVRNPRFDYVALGHIHKPQDLNRGAQPPVIYPGSIERVDFGEAEDERFFVTAEVQKGAAQVEWRRLEHTRPFIDRTVTLTSGEDVTATLLAALPANCQDAIVRLIVHYPRLWDDLIDEAALRRHLAGAFEFHFVRRPQIQSRIRLSAEQTASSLQPLELLDQYWQAEHLEASEIEALDSLARQIFSEEAGEEQQ